MKGTFFARWSRITLISVYLVIVAGGVVRMTGSGMGCPDWPKCFGRWVPPTDVSQLPKNYQEIYADRGYAETEFNAFKTWTESINRYIGALSGLFVLIMAALSFRYWKTDRWLVFLAVFQLFLMGFQGWMGAKVVESVLEPVKITLHMFVALMIVAVNLLIVAKSWTRPKRIPPYNRAFLLVLVAALIVSLAQVILGTQVRQEIDHLAESLGPDTRSTWIALLSGMFEFHRTFAIVVLVINGVLLYLNWKVKVLLPAMAAMGAILMVEVISGIAMSYMGIPAYLQPTHLVLASVLFGVQFYLLVVYLRQLRAGMRHQPA